MSYTMLKTILVLSGLAIMALGLNIGLGGIPTLGWQTDPSFVQVGNAEQFAVQDNHIRFIGGFWFAAGLILTASVRWFAALRPVLICFCGMIFLAGLMRLSALNTELLLSADIMPSLLAELILFPLIALWIKNVDPVEPEPS